MPVQHPLNLNDLLGHAAVRQRDKAGRLFSRFGRIVTPENAHIDGTGLGLYLAREIARHHGGDILVESREGYGSRFTLMLPVTSHAVRVSGVSATRAASI